MPTGECVVVCLSKLANSVTVVLESSPAVEAQLCSDLRVVRMFRDKSHSSLAFLGPCHG